MSDYKVETFTISENNQLFFVSDLHFFHKRIVEFTGRPTTFEELSEWIITQCNNKIPKPKKGEKVTTIHLGDFAFSCTNEQLEESSRGDSNEGVNLQLNAINEAQQKLCQALNSLELE